MSSANSFADLNYRNRTQISSDDYLFKDNRRRKDPAFENLQFADLGFSLGIGADCGKISLKSSLRASLKNFLNAGYFGDIGRDILGASPMLLACYMSPTWCAILKHTRINAQFAARNRQAQCSIIEKYIDQRADEFHQARQECVARVLSETGNSEEAMQKCGNRKLWEFDTKSWSGEGVSEVNKLLEDSAKWAGLDRPGNRHVVDMVKQFVGDTIVARGRASVDYGPKKVFIPPRVFLNDLKSVTHAKLCNGILRRLNSSGSKSSTLKEITEEDIKSLSGRAQVELIDKQTIRYLSLLSFKKQEIYCRKLSSAIALARLEDETDQSLDFLQLASTNPHLPESRRMEVLEKRRAFKTAVDKTLATNSASSDPLNKVTSEITKEGKVAEEHIATRRAQVDQARKNQVDADNKTFNCSDGVLCKSSWARSQGAGLFSDVAQDAYYTALGLGLHERIRAALVSEPVFKGLALFLFAITFFAFLYKYFAQFTPLGILTHKTASLSKLFKILLLLFVGMGLLKVGAESGVRNYDDQSWHNNPYIVKNYGHLNERYEVNFIFDLLTRSAEEISAYATYLVDKIFAKTHSQTGAPDFFYRALMYSSTALIDDPVLKEKVAFYSEECLLKVVTEFEQRKIESVADSFFSFNSFGSNEIDLELEKIEIGSSKTCLDLKEDIQRDTVEYVKERGGVIASASSRVVREGYMSQTQLENMSAANALLNHYFDEKEASLGVMKGSQVPGGAGWFTQYLNRSWSFPGMISLFSFGEGNHLHGTSEAAEKATEFNELLIKAPTLRGIIRMVLIALFPLIPFFLFTGRWRILLTWYFIYLSVCLWTPVWTAIYHITTGVALSSDIMEEFGKLNQDISLVGAGLIKHRIYYFYAIMTWLKITAAVMLTGGVYWVQRGILAESHEEQAPGPIKTVGHVATSAAVGGAAGALRGAVSSTAAAESTQLSFFK